MYRRGVDDSSTEDPVRREAEGCIVRDVRPGRGDEVPRARATTTVSVRRELPRSRAGPRGQSTLLSYHFGACRHSCVSCTELYFLVLTVCCIKLYNCCL